MKTVKVKYLLRSDETIYKRFLIETEQDVQSAFNAKRINRSNITGIRALIQRGEQIILNSNGGYCPLKGTWKIV